MCGISGFNWRDEEAIKAMNNALRHRGPDGEGVHVDEHVSLGHRRLSIIDLSSAGAQPMCSEDGRIWLTFNGEIYNYRELRRDLEHRGHAFKSATDSEVVLHSYEEYGSECFQRFNGMWGLCIYDSVKCLLLLSRDRFGIKPLYYYVGDNRFIFSSMIAGILCHDVATSPNDAAIMQYLAHNLEDHTDQTFFNGISRVPAGAILSYDLKNGEHKIDRWYQIRPQGIQGAADIRARFIESVRKRTVADVAIGSCLSGGVDSSAIVSVLDTVLSDRFSTYSLVAPGSKLDESRYIRQVGRTTNTQQFFTTIDEDGFLAEIHDFVAAQEEPVTGVSPYAQYRVMQLAHGEGAKVLLDGQGGDELFAGYAYYFAYYYFELLRRMNFRTLAKETTLYTRNFKNLYPLAMLVFMLIPTPAKSHLWKLAGKKWLNHELLDSLGPRAADPRWQAMDLGEAMQLTLQSTAIPHLLRWEDKNSMRWSIESRVPFLDVDLVEAAYSLASEQKLRDGRTKAVFRDAMKDIVPRAIMDRKDKIGFAAPGDALFRSPDVVAFARNIIESPSFLSRPYWRVAEIRKTLEAHVRWRANAGDIIWKWVNLELWLRLFFGNR